MDRDQEAEAASQPSAWMSTMTSGTAIATTTSFAAPTTTPPTEPQTQAQGPTLSEAEKSQLVDRVLKTASSIIKCRDTTTAYRKVDSPTFDAMIDAVARFMRQQGFSAPLFYKLDELLGALCEMGHHCAVLALGSMQRYGQLMADDEDEAAEQFYEDALDDRARAALFRHKARALLRAVRDHWVYAASSRTFIRVGIVVKAMDQYEKTLEELEKGKGAEGGRGRGGWGCGVVGGCNRAARTRKGTGDAENRVEEGEDPEPEADMDALLRFVGSQFD